MISILDLTYDDLHAAIAQMHLPPYRADQVVDWVFKKGQTDPAAMTNLPGELKRQLTVLSSKVVARSDSTDGTIKLLLEFAPCCGAGVSPACGEAILASPGLDSAGGTPAAHAGRMPAPQAAQRVECVLIPTETRATACLSTQIGCDMACAFCASGLDKLQRNLTAGEILQQVLHLQQASGKRVTHVVFMGMGEPLANYESTLLAVRAIVDPLRLGVSARHVTISTVGIPKAIRRLAAEDLPVTLAISLHAPNDVLRQQLIPSAKRFPIADILAAARQFFESRGREVTLEYVLLAGVNDTPVCAEAFAQIARTLRCNVNLIRYNPVAGLPYQRPSQAAVQAFAARLQRRGINAHARKSRGLDTAAACGQLRRTQDQPVEDDTLT